MEFKKKGESETLKFPKIFYESILSKEIKIGEYSNKNFISVISSLSEFPDLIKNLFIFYKKTTRRKEQQKDIKDLIQRKERMMRDYTTLTLLKIMNMNLME